MAVTALTTAACGGGSSDTGSHASGGDGAALPTIELTPLGDAPALRLGRSTTVPTVVNVWATWCTPCRKEMPAFDATARAYGTAVRFVGINLGDGADAAQRFVDETGVSFDQYLDPGSTAQAALSITQMPATVFVRADGSIAATHNGALGADDLRKLLDEQLHVARPAG